MAKSKQGEVAPKTIASSAKPKKVVGLLGVIEAETKGEAWVPDDNELLANIGLGLGATPEAKRLVILGIISENIAALDKKLAELKPKRGAPKKAMSTDVVRAAAVLEADDFLRRKTGESVKTQKEAIELAMQFDRLLCDAGHRDKPLFGITTSIERLQTSVSKGLREFDIEDARFTKK